MTVLTPLFLLGLAGLAVPILLHLLRHRERRTLVFPALRYLKRTTQEHARIVRLRQLLLLALRLSAVLFIVLAGARLVLPLGGNDDPPAGLAIVIDNGLTSGAVVGGGRVLDSIRVRAMEALDRTGPRDQIWVIPAGAPLQASVPVSPEGARVALEALSPTHVTPDLPVALERAGNLLDAAAPDLRELLLISNLRPEALQRPDAGLEVRSERVVIAPPPGPLPTNRGIGELQVSGGLVPRAGDLGEIEVRLVGSEVAGSTVRIYLDGRLVGTSSAAPDGSAVLPLPRLPAGWVEGRVEVEPDGLRGDDVMYFALLAIPPPPVQVLGQVAPFLEEALSVLDEAGRIQLIQEGEPMVQIMGGGPSSGLSPNAAVIVVPPDEGALLPSLNQELSRLLPGWSLEATPRATGTELQVDDGLLIDFLPSQPSVRQAYTIQPAESPPTWSELLTLSDGSPWIVESESGGRSIVVLASPITVEASDLPASAAMLPLMELLASRSFETMAASRTPAGEPFQLPDEAATVRLPDETVRSVLGISTFRDTELAGVYRIFDPDQELLGLVAVNAVSPESTEGLTAAEAASILGEAWEEVAVGMPWPQSVLRDRSGREVARPLLFALLLVLVGEGWLASAGRRNAQPGEGRGGENQ